MAAVANLVHETSTSTGTGNFTVAAVDGKQRFSAAFSTGVTTNVFDYFISNRNAAEYERGTGHMSDANTLVRDTVIESTNSNSAVSFSAGTKDVTNDIPAAVQLRSSMIGRKNRWVDGALQVSQQNGNSSATTDAYYVADQLSVHRVTSAGTITAQRVQSVTPGGAKDRARVTITTADTSLAAGEYLYLRTRIEGQNVADFRYGSAGARQSILRFLFKGPSGTYAVRLTNSAKNRSYVALFSPASANTDEIIELVIPGDTSGTWLTDTGIGIEACIVLACGSTFQGTTGWQAGDVLGTSAVSNGMGTGSAVFELGEFGFYLDPEQIGVPPPWEVLDFGSELLRCQRYYRKSYDYGTAAASVTFTGMLYFIYNTTSTGGGGITVKWPEMRVAPAVTLYDDAGNVGKCFNSASNKEATADLIGLSGARFYTVDGTATNQVAFHYVADARL